MPEADVTFNLTESNLKELLKMAAILATPDLALVGTKGGDIILKVCDKKNDTSNNFDILHLSISYFVGNPLQAYVETPFNFELGIFCRLRT